MWFIMPMVVLLCGCATSWQLDKSLKPVAGNYSYNEKLCSHRFGEDSECHHNYRENNLNGAKLDLCFSTCDVKKSHCMSIEPYIIEPKTKEVCPTGFWLELFLANGIGNYYCGNYYAGILGTIGTSLFISTMLIAMDVVSSDTIPSGRWQWWTLAVSGGGMELASLLLTID